jgi:hypothetical protein
MARKQTGDFLLAVARVIPLFATGSIRFSQKLIPPIPK